MKKIFAFFCVVGIFVILASIIITTRNASPNKPIGKTQYRPLYLARFKEEYDEAVIQQEVWVNSPYLIGLRFAGYPNVERVLPDKVTVFHITPTKQIVVVQKTTRIFDDSVSAEEIRVDLVLEGEMWEVKWAGGRWRCKPGRGSSIWTKRLCS